MLDGVSGSVEGKTVAIVHPAWHSCGSHAVFCSQAAAYRAMGAEVVALAVGTRLNQGPRNRGFWSYYYKATSDLMAHERCHTGPSGLSLLVDGRLRRALKLVRSDYAAQMAGLAELSPLPGGLARRGRIDLIHCNHYFNMPLALRLKARFGAPILLDTHDVQSRQYALRGAAGLFSRRKSSLAEMEETEIAIAAKADVLAHINADEHDYFAARLPDHRHVLLYPALSARRGHHDHYFLVVASANYPNYVGIAWLLERVLPLAGQVRLEIIGNIDEEVRERAPGLYLRHRDWFKGRVDDLQRFYDNAAAVLLPVMAGHGLAIKTVEALESGAPLIATPLAFRGMAIDLSKIDNLRLADSPRVFARHINELNAAATDAQRDDDDRRMTAGEWRQLQGMKAQRATASTRKVFEALFSFPSYVAKLDRIGSGLLAAGGAARGRSEVRAEDGAVAGARQGVAPMGAG
jgi:glycosyltransferase involved in cell wall biosynthesis